MYTLDEVQFNPLLQLWGDFSSWQRGYGGLVPPCTSAAKCCVCFPGGVGNSFKITLFGRRVEKNGVRISLSYFQLWTVGGTGGFIPLCGAKRNL